MEEVIKSFDVGLIPKYCALLLFITCPGMICDCVKNHFIL